MLPSEAHARVVASTASSSIVKCLSLFQCVSDGTLVSLPRSEVQLVARFGAPAASGLDVHVMGPRQRAHRKQVRSGQRAVAARLRLGAPPVVLGVPASEIAGRVVPLEEVWGDAATRRLCERLAGARSVAEAATILDGAIAEHTRAQRHRAGSDLVMEAAERLTDANVNAVAAELGVSERHLRRVFREAVGVSPKTFAKLARFRRALGAARRGTAAGWAGIAAHAGYYDQAHLIAEFRAIAGVTPRALLEELRAAPSLD